MELIDQLEDRISGLLARHAELLEEIRQLKESQAGNAELEEENRRLKEELDREKALREAVLTRVEGLIDRMKHETGEA